MIRRVRFCVGLSEDLQESCECVKASMDAQRLSAPPLCWMMLRAACCRLDALFHAALMSASTLAASFLSSPRLPLFLPSAFNNEHCTERRGARTFLKTTKTPFPTSFDEAAGPTIEQTLRPSTSHYTNTPRGLPPAVAMMRRGRPRLRLSPGPPYFSLCALPVRSLQAPGFVVRVPTALGLKPVGRRYARLRTTERVAEADREVHAGSDWRAGWLSWTVHKC
ncbi:hypothetical protein IWX90DRAFT_52886 [Phyllosticta citrichinensis]|uniref:Uncharacterized protein n=1 Tax=Phyllosticta citrichinensis TaxID=1130410 RepID=A0ABR1XIH1_9PEZI